MKRKTNYPEGRILGTFEMLHRAHCIQTGWDQHEELNDAEHHFGEMFRALMLETEGNICKGCPVLNDGACKAYQTFHSQAISDRKAEQMRREERLNATKPPGTDKYPGMSIRQIANELGISKGEVRRRKQAGIL